MKRREFITLAGGAATAWPLAARAQQAPAPLIGFLSSRSPGESAGVVAAFRQGIREIGFIEGQNLAIAFRWAEGHYGRLPALAAELVGLPVALLFSAGGPPTAFAAKAATSTIPIVFSAVSDPVEIGLVPSLNQPGGNVTGMGVFNATLGAKRIELTKELMPRAAGIAYLLNPSNPSSEIESKGALAAARALRIELHVLNASTEYELDAAFAAELGWIEGRTVAIEYRWADGQSERLAEIAAEFARLKVDIIVTGGTPAVAAAKQARCFGVTVFSLRSLPAAFLRPVETC